MKKNSATQKPSLAVVIPCYNEETVLPETISRIDRKIEELESTGIISRATCVYLVDDGSNDRTWGLIEDTAKKLNRFKGIKLSRNYGHQNALLAGLFNTREDLVISIDADLQDDIHIFNEMIHHYCHGIQVVYGVRSKRQSDTFFKRTSAVLFYKLLGKLGVDIVFNHADYRLMSRRAIEELKSFNEVNLFLRGMIPLIGFASKTVEYNRSERLSGRSKYPFFKMARLAWDGISSFSNFPLRLVSLIGFVVFFLSTGMGIWALSVKLFTDSAVPGWASSILPIFFLGGIQILSIGIIGEYIGKLYMEVKQRPRFIVEKTTDHQSLSGL